MGVVILAIVALTVITLNSFLKAEGMVDGIVYRKEGSDEEAIHMLTIGVLRKYNLNGHVKMTYTNGKVPLWYDGLTHGDPVKVKIVKGRAVKVRLLPLYNYSKRR